MCTQSYFWVYIMDIGINLIIMSKYEEIIKKQYN